MFQLKRGKLAEERTGNLGMDLANPAENSDSRQKRTNIKAIFWRPLFLPILL